ncbi:MAG: hypothetical protein HY699_08950 [Deltaproteobacteria bacterium]|nr:hypothetical protein [Deltaproteobacteria bacterium]
MANDNGNAQPPGLRAAAEALEGELRRFESLTTAIEHGRLDSEKQLKQSAERLQELFACEERLGAHVQALNAAITAAQERQLAQANLVRVRAEEINRRAELLRALLVRFESLKDEAMQLNRTLQEQMPHDGQGLTPEKLPALLRVLHDLDERMQRLGGDAASLMQAADGERFAETARQAEAFRQQLLSTRNRVNVLRKSLGQGNGS